MKLLLTSGGVNNPAVVQALLRLVAKPASELKVAFIPTAMNTEPGDKGWAVDQLIFLRNMGLKQLDVVDISAMPKALWLPRLEESDVIFVNGGNTTHLMTCCNESGLTEEIPRLLRDRVYVGVSAGSYIATPDTRFNSDHAVAMDALHLVDFGLQVHMGNPHFPFVKDEAAALQRVKELNCPYAVYVLDDKAAITVDGDTVALVGSGKHLKIEPSSGAVR